MSWSQRHGRNRFQQNRRVHRPRPRLKPAHRKTRAVTLSSSQRASAKKPYRTSLSRLPRSPRRKGICGVSPASRISRTSPPACRSTPVQTASSCGASVVTRTISALIPGSRTIPTESIKPLQSRRAATTFSSIVSRSFAAHRVRCTAATLLEASSTSSPSAQRMNSRPMSCSARAIMITAWRPSPCQGRSLTTSGAG